MKLKYLIYILLLFLIYFIQINFLYTNNLLASINLFFILIIWLSLIESNWLWWVVIWSGVLMDIQFEVPGYYLISFIFLILVVKLLKNRIAVTGRLTQYFSIFSLSLIIYIIFQFILRWLISLFTNTWTILSITNVSQLTSIVQIYLINLLVLSILYFIFRNKLSTL